MALRVRGKYGTGTRWRLGESGLRLIAAANHFHVRNLQSSLAMTRPLEQSP
jgi:hypothetical protein